MNKIIITTILNFYALFQIVESLLARMVTFKFISGLIQVNSHSSVSFVIRNLLHLETREIMREDTLIKSNLKFY
jgi:hypothetical protein